MAVIWKLRGGKWLREVFPARNASEKAFGPSDVPRKWLCDVRAGVTTDRGLRFHQSGRPGWVPTTLESVPLDRADHRVLPRQPARGQPFALTAQRPPHHPDRAHAQKPPRARRMDAATADPLGRANRAQHRWRHHLHPRTPNPPTARLPRLPRHPAPEQTARRSAAGSRVPACAGTGRMQFKSLESILRQGLERLPLAQQNLPLLPDEHINLRGPGYYH